MGAAAVLKTMKAKQNAELVTDFLKADRGRYFCHACVGLNANVHPVNQVNQIIRPLGQTKEYRYSKTSCSGCGRELSCIAFVG